MSSSKNKGNNPLQKSYFGGFTLIELMVTVGIFVFMTYLVMARYNNYYSGTIFKNLAYDVAITIRQAQSYGISVKVDEDSGQFNRAYGVYIAGGEAVEFSLHPYTRDQAGKYTKSDAEKVYKLKHGAIFKTLKVSTNDVVYTDAQNLAIIFQRPNPEAIICAQMGGVQDCSTYKFAKLRLEAPNEAFITVKANSSGQVSIE